MIGNLTPTAPITYSGTDPESMIGCHVLIRPYYHVPISRSGFASKRSPWAFEAVVIEPFGLHSDSVIIEFLDRTGPWHKRAAYRVSECHRKGTCACAACCTGGTGIRELRGA